MKKVRKDHGHRMGIGNEDRFVFEDNVVVHSSDHNRNIFLLVKRLAQVDGPKFSRPGKDSKFLVHLFIGGQKNKVSIFERFLVEMTNDFGLSPELGQLAVFFFDVRVIKINFFNRKFLFLQNILDLFSAQRVCSD